MEVVGFMPGRRGKGNSKKGYCRKPAEKGCGIFMHFHCGQLEEKFVFVIVFVKKSGKGGCGNKGR